VSRHQPYQLLDFGGGRKLERFGTYVVDRPSPAAEGAVQRDPQAWSQAAARYDRLDGGQGRWTIQQEPPLPWTVELPQGTFELRLTEWGQVGLFPEQWDNWRWIAEQVRAVGHPCTILNLFAYTGASTMAAASAGAAVTHVDAASGVVTWARRNAELSGLAAAPIRWIAEDALKFVRRELNRGRRYDAVILDPPRYGHGPHGEVWQLEQQLPELLDSCLQLMGRDPRFLLLTCHSGELARAEGLLRTTMAAAAALRSTGTMQAADMMLVSAAGDSLHAGARVRWSAQGRASRAARSTTSNERSAFPRP
jgi:23S rRNA (cytosine1962-C5)-methyltransferase